MKLFTPCLCKALSVGLATRQQGHLLQTLYAQRPMGAGVVVPEGHFFAMGDNRDDSLDSRLYRRFQNIVYFESLF